MQVKEFAMSPSEAIPYAPVVCGNWAVAELKLIYGWGDTLGVMAFDLKANKQTKIFTGEACCLALAGSLAMWCQSDGKNENSSILMGYDLATGKPWKPELPEGVDDPVADGDHVVYECRDLIYLYDIKTGACKRISDERPVHRYPNVCGDMVVWLKYEDSDFKRSQVRGYRISNGQEYLLTNQYDECSRPETDGVYVVWQTRSLCSFAKEIKTGQTRMVKDALIPDVSDGIMVYEKALNPHNVYRGPRVVCGIDLRANGVEFRVSKGNSVRQVFMNGNRVVWNEGKTLHVADLTRIP